MQNLDRISSINSLLQYFNISNKFFIYNFIGEKSLAELTI